MLRKLATLLLLCALCILSWPAMGTVQDTKSEKDDENASLLAKDLAAFKALRSLLASRRYVLTNERLVDMVGEYLRKTKNHHPTSSLLSRIYRSPSTATLQNSMTP